MAFKVADISQNQPDQAGAIVTRVYVKIDELYAVYGTADRIMIQFADDPVLGADQRKSLSEVAVTRGVIEGYLTEMRDDQKLVSRVPRYERRLADALTLGLQGQSNHAAVEMESLRQDLAEERRSGTRQLALLASLGTGCAFILLIVVLSSSLFNFPLSPAGKAGAANLWFAGGVGTVGAFFWTALAIRNREIEPSITRADTVVDAALRMFVGALSGALIYALIKSGAFGVELGGASITGNDAFSVTEGGWLLVLLVAFVAGFLQRFVPDLLSRATVSEAKSDNTKLSSNSVAEDVRSTERNPLGGAPAPVPAPPPDGAASRTEEATADDPEKDEDDCCDRPGAPELLTEDVELPEALGGVEEERAAA